MKIKNLKKAVGEYQRLNKYKYSINYGYLMFDKATGELWTDYFCDMGHNSWKEYKSDSIINLGRMMESRALTVNMKNVQNFIKEIA